MSIGDFVRVKKTLLAEQLSVIRRYYPKSPRFALVDLSLGFFSLFFNPYRICRKSGSIYGETPLSTLHRIADQCRLSSDDIWLEIGSGRGKGCFWIALFTGCRAVGVEKIFLFARLAQFLAALFRLDVHFYAQEMEEADFSKATCVYLYGTTLSDAEIERLAEKMKALPSGAKVVSISAPLPGWGCRSFPVSFPWGETEAFLHVKK